MNNDQPKMIQIPTKNLKPQHCSACGSMNFKLVYRLNVLPALLSPTMKAELIPQPIYVCDICQHEFKIDGDNENAAN